MLGDPACRYYKDSKTGDTIALWEVVEPGRPNRARSRFYEAARKLGQVVPDPRKFEGGNFSGEAVEKNLDCLMISYPLMNMPFGLTTLRATEIPRFTEPGELPDQLLWENKKPVNVYCVGGRIPDWVKKRKDIITSYPPYYKDFADNEYDVREGDVIVESDDDELDSYTYINILEFCSVVPEAGPKQYITPEGTDVIVWQVQDKGEFPFWVQCLLSEGAIKEMPEDSVFRLQITRAGGNNPSDQLVKGRLLPGDYLIMDCDHGIIYGAKRSEFKSLKFQQRFDKYQDYEG